MLNLSITFPDWLNEFVSQVEPVDSDLESRMGLAVELARLNVERATGGPFGAAVFDASDGSLVSCAVNLVTWSGLSSAHAEVLAISLAQKKTGALDLGFPRRYQLVTSAEPCWMCLGAIHWSGLTDVVSGARDEDVRNIGFDEGHKPDDWVRLLRQRGVRVETDVLRSESVSVLRQYAEMDGPIYNPNRMHS